MKKNLPAGQIAIIEPHTKSVSGGCYKCVCRTCLMWWSDRCPYGSCYDDHRAEVMPYDLNHPNKPPRTAWSNWKNDQAAWCRGGSFYPVSHCGHYVEYKGCRITQCLKANVATYQDGYMKCSIIDIVGCERCYEEFYQSTEETP